MARRSADNAAPLADRFLEQSLLLTIVAHAAAMLAMAILLLPGMPGGSAPGTAARIGYIAAHPWLWRLGWLPWQLTALSDVVLALALLRSAWIPRVPAIVVLLATAAAVGIEQPGELRWVTEGVRLAQAAVQQNDPALYLHFEASIYLQVAAWAATMYTIAALGWTWCFARSGAWNRWLGWLSIPTWGILLASSVGPLLPKRYQPGDTLGALGNAAGFVLLLIWLCAVTELVLRRARPESPHGRMAAWRHPWPGLPGFLISAVATSRLARAYGEWLPPVAFASEITNVIYANYLVDADMLAPYVPPGLELQRLGPAGSYAFFTHLSYRHGHFGPRLLGPLRRIMPSPVQSNWRIHVLDPRTNTRGVYFITTAISSSLYALAARLLSEGLPMHVLRRGKIAALPDRSLQAELDPGTGSAPDLAMRVWPAEEPELAGPWRECFGSFQAMLAYCVPQDRAISSQPWYRQITRQEIELGIPLSACEPLRADLVSRAARQIVGDAQPLCFRVAQVAFGFSGEQHDRM